MPTLAVDTRVAAFSGKIIPDNCTVGVNGTSANSTVALNNLSQTASGADKKVGDLRPPAIVLTECDVAITNLDIRFDGTCVAGYNEEVLQPTGVATDLGVRMLSEGNSDYVEFDDSKPDDSLNKANGGSVVFNYKARVIQVGSTVLTTGDYTA